MKDCLFEVYVPEDFLLHKIMIIVSNIADARFEVLTVVLMEIEVFILDIGPCRLVISYWRC